MTDVPEQPADLGPDPWTQVKPASELDQLNFMKAMVYGRNGSGKTRMVAGFQKPLVGVTELQGVPTIRKACPGAVIYHDPDGQPGIKTALDLRRFVKMAKSAAQNGCDAVCLDGLTDAQRILQQAFTSRQGKKAGKAKTSMESWGLIIDATARLVRELRDLQGVHVLVTCLSSEERDGDALIVRPSLSGKRLPEEVGQYFNAVGYAYREETERGLRHQVLFSSGDRYSVKPLEGLDVIEPPEPLHWVGKALGGKVPRQVTERVQSWSEMIEPFEEEEDAA